MTRKQAIIDQLAGGVIGLLKGRKVTVYDGTGSLGADRTVTRHRRRDRRSRRSPAEPVILADRVAAPDDSRLRRRRPVRRHLRRVPLDRRRSRPRPSSSAAAPSAASSPRCWPTSASRSPSSRPCRRSSPAATPTSPRSSSGRSRSAASPSGPACMVQGHTPDPSARHHGLASATARRVDVDLVVVSVGRRPFADLPRPRRHRRRGRRPRLRRGRRPLPHRRTRASGPSATSSPPRSSPTSASPRGCSPSSDILGEDPLPLDHHGTPWCIYCHPEVAFAGLHRGVGQRRPASTSSPRRTASSATVGR